MKAVELVNDTDNTVEVGVAKTYITDHAGRRPCNDQLFIAISNEEGEHTALFTTDQAIALIQTIAVALRQIAANDRALLVSKIQSHD